jgi:site-specific recombinase XerD
LAFGQYRVARNLALIDILFATGIRVGEVSTLNIDDFFEHKGMFKIKGKGGRARLAFAVDKKSLQIQKDHLHARAQVDSESSALFLNSSRKRLSTQGNRRMSKKLLYHPDIDTILEKQSSNGVAQHVRRYMSLDSGFATELGNYVCNSLRPSAIRISAKST